MGCAASTSPHHERGGTRQIYSSRSIQSGADVDLDDHEEEEPEVYLGPHDYPSELASDGDVCSESRVKVALRQTYHSMVGYMKHGINGDVNQFPADPVEPLSQHAASTIATWVDFTTVSGCVMGLVPVVRLRGRCRVKSPSETALTESSPPDPPSGGINSPPPDALSLESGGSGRGADESSVRSVGTQGSVCPAGSTTAGVTTAFHYGIVEAVRGTKLRARKTSSRREDRSGAASPTGSGASDGQPVSHASPFSSKHDINRGPGENPATTASPASRVQSRSPSNVTFTTDNFFGCSPRTQFSPQGSFKSPFSPTQSFGGFGPMVNSRANSVSAPSPEPPVQAAPDPKYRPPQRAVLTAWNKILSTDPTIKLDLSAGYEIGCQVDEGGVPKKVTLHRRIDDPAFFTTMLREIIRATLTALQMEVATAKETGIDQSNEDPSALQFTSVVSSPVIPNAVTVQVMGRFSPLPIPPALASQGPGCVLGEPLSRSTSKHSASLAFNEESSLSLPETSASDPPPHTDSSGSIANRDHAGPNSLCPLIKGIGELPIRSTSVAA